MNREADEISLLQGHIRSLEEGYHKQGSEFRKKLDELKTLYEIGNLLVSSLDQQIIKGRVVEAITKLMDVEAGSLLMVDDEKGELYFEIALGEKGNEVKEIRLKIGEGVAGWVAERGESLLVHDVRNDQRFSNKADNTTGFITMNVLCCPVKMKGKVIAVLEAINRKNGFFTQGDLSVLEMFSNQVAIAIENARLYEEVKETFIATIEAFADAIEKRDPYTGGHTKRVLNYSLSIAKYLDMTQDEKEILKFSAILHDIGKIGVNDSILQKQSPFRKEEADVMKRHTMFGSDIISHVRQLKDLIPGMFAHHERPDGKGYPMGLKGNEIPLIAKIISVADAYDAITTDRPYRKGTLPQDALAEIKRCSGTQFDRDVVEAFVKTFENGEI